MASEKFTREPVVVRKVEKSKLTAFHQAELAQARTDYYGRSSANSATNSLFADEDFGDELIGQEYTTTRVAWINVPTGKTVEDVAALLAANSSACIYRKLSFDVMDVLTEEQKAVWNDTAKYDFDRDEVIDRLRVRNDEGKIVLDPTYGVPMYRVNYFSKTERADDDYRAASAARLGLTQAAPAAVSAENFERMSAQGNAFDA